MDDPVVVEVGDPLDQPLEPVADLGQRHPVGILLQDAGQARAGDVLHDDERIAGVVGLHVEDRQQVRALQVHALHDPAPLDVEVAQDQLERDFLAGIGGGVIDLAEAPAADGPLDRVAVQRAGARTEGVAALCLGRGWLGACLRFPWGHRPRSRLVFRLVNDRFVHAVIAVHSLCHAVLQPSHSSVVQLPPRWPLSAGRYCLHSDRSDLTNATPNLIGRHRAIRDRDVAFDSQTG